MDSDFSTNVSQQDDEFDIDLRLEAGSDPGENPSLTSGLCGTTNSSTCSHTSPKLCC